MLEFRIDGWTVRPLLRRITGPHGERQLEIKAHEVLLHLADHAGGVVTRQALLDTVWEEAIISDEVLTHTIWELRKAFGDNARKPRVIETIPRRGYRLIAPVSWLDTGPTSTERYRFEQEIGRGGMGVVWRSRDLLLGRTVAIKVLSEELDRDPKSKERFLREAKVAAGLDHPNLCTLHEFDETSDGRLFLVMPLYQGETLQQRLERGLLPVNQAVEIAAQIGDGLAAAHGAGIVHRDIKPSNVMLLSDREGSEKRVVLLDFGRAKFIDGTKLTEDGSQAGTTSYMSPEQTRGEEVGPASDIWSLGVVLYQLLTGELPLRGANQPAIIYSILEDEMAALPKELSTNDYLDGLMRWTLCKNPDKRLADASVLSRQLRAAISRDSEGRIAIPVPETQISPYPGLSSFSKERAAFFFGRRREVEATWSKLQQQNLTAIIGPSGAGKSSFLRAGVLPASPIGWRHVLFSPGSTPMAALGEALVSELTNDEEALRRLVHFEKAEVAFSTIVSWRRKHGEALLVVDQFEELFHSYESQTTS